MKRHYLHEPLLAICTVKSHVSVSVYFSKYYRAIPIAMLLPLPFDLYQKP
jgi:hypothetical protein